MTYSQAKTFVFRTFGAIDSDNKEIVVKDTFEYGNNKDLRVGLMDASYNLGINYIERDLLIYPKIDQDDWLDLSDLVSDFERDGWELTLLIPTVILENYIKVLKKLSEKDILYTTYGEEGTLKALSELDMKLFKKTENGQYVILYDNTTKERKDNESEY